MKKTLLFIAAAATILSVGCSKSDSASNTTPATSATVTINGTTYTQVVGADSATNDFFGATGNILAAIGSTTNGRREEFIAFFRNTAKPASGSYNIAGNIFSFTGSQVLLLIEDSSAAGEGLYSSDSVTTLNATVTNSGGKLSVSVPSLRMTGFFSPVSGSSYNDSVIVSGTIKEQ